MCLILKAASRFIGACGVCSGQIAVKDTESKIRAEGVLTSGFSVGFVLGDIRLREWKGRVDCVGQEKQNLR